MLPRDMSSPWVAELDEAEDDFEEDDEFDEDEEDDEDEEYEEEFDDEPRPHPHRRSEDWE